LSATLAELLSQQLVGVYLHGSLAMGCFNAHHSDLDLLVITARRMSPATRRQIIEYLLACSRQPHPVEISFLTRRQLRPWRFPTPFDLHYSEMWRDALSEALHSSARQAWGIHPHHDPDLAAHITVLNARGICLRGQPVAAIFPAVPADDFHAALAGDLHGSLETIADDPVYAVLNCCRTYAYLREDHILSKEEGGLWMLKTFPAEHADVVASALAGYRSQSEHQSFDPDALAAFATTMRRQLAPILQRLDPPG
jgi:streptomycin 3"-adenylyltransferase